MLDLGVAAAAAARGGDVVWRVRLRQ